VPERDWRVSRLFATIAHMATQTHTRPKYRYALWKRPDGKWMARWISGDRIMNCLDPFVDQAAARRWARANKAREIEWALRASR